MASPISFSGIASGIDSQAIVDATTASARAVRVTPNQNKVNSLQDTNTAFDQLRTKVNSLRKTLESISSLAGGAVSKTGTSSKESVVSATATNGASNGSYQVTVNALAKNHTYSFDQTYTSGASPIQSDLTGSESASDRTITFTVGTGANLETVSIEISNGTYSISQFVSDFNKATKKAQASLVNTGTESSPAYKIVIASTYEGTEKGTIARTSLGAALTNLSATSESAAADASLSITGIGTVTRSTNSISNVIPGVTLNLSSLGSATVKIAEDASTTTSRVQDFVTGYNDILAFIKENNQITRDESSSEVKNIFAPLSTTRTDDNLVDSLRAGLLSASASGGSAVRVLADLGLTTQRDGTLAFDSTKFQTALSSEPSSVNDLLRGFADTMALTGGTIDKYTRYNGFFDIIQNSNRTQITDLNKRIADAEKQIQKNADDLKARYARLESLMSRLQQQQSSLASALGSNNK